MELLLSDPQRLLQALASCLVGHRLRPTQIVEPLGAAIGANIGRDLGQVGQECAQMRFGQMRDQEVQANEHVAEPLPVLFGIAETLLLRAKKATTGHACA